MCTHILLLLTHLVLLAFSVCANLALLGSLVVPVEKPLKVFCSSLKQRNLKLSVIVYTPLSSLCVLSWNWNYNMLVMCWLFSLYLSQLSGESATTPSITAACPCGWNKTTGVHYANKTGSCRGLASEDVFIHPVFIHFGHIWFKDTDLILQLPSITPVCMLMTVKWSVWTFLAACTLPLSFSDIHETEVLYSLTTLSEWCCEWVFVKYVEIKSEIVKVW